MWNLIPWKKDSGGTMTADPFEREFSRLRDDFDSLLSRVWGGGFPASDQFFESRWGLEIEETDTHYVAHVPAPGFEIGEFDVHVSGNHLVVKAEHKESSGNGNGKGHGARMQRYGKFQTTIPLPEGVERDQIDAQYKNGILEVRIPKGQPGQSKRIAVKSG
jgi:HSP20 family protein